MSVEPVLIIPGVSPLALMRFVVRRPWPDRDGLILGCRVADQGLFKVGRVYELKQVFGEVILYDVGTSRMVEADSDTAYEVGAHWGKDVNAILTEVNTRLWVPREFDEPKEPNNG